MSDVFDKYPARYPPSAIKKLEALREQIAESNVLLTRVLIAGPESRLPAELLRDIRATLENKL